jgi:zinc/manganese transport system permease protein
LIPLLSAVSVGSPGFSWNLISDLQQMLAFEFMRNAFAAGTAVALVAGIAGYFVVLRRTAFASHALSHIGFAGATGAVDLNVAPLWGLLAFCLASGAIMGALGQRIRDRDTVIGIVMAGSLALGALFLSIYSGNDAEEAISILFGEILGVSTGELVQICVVGAVTLCLLALVYRPLLFASVDEDVAEARRVPVRSLSVVFMLILALAVAVAVQVVGVLLIFALLVTPAAIAERVTRSSGRAMLVGVVVALVSTWVGIFVSWYNSWPVSFFIVAISTLAYAAVRIVGLVGTSRPAQPESAHL